MRTWHLAFFISILIPTLTRAAKTALVIAPKAVIFGDQKLSVPLGYVRQGRKLKVGEVKRKRGTIVPIVVSGKIAYIQTKDIVISQDEEDEVQVAGPSIQEHQIDEGEVEFSLDDLTKNNFIIGLVGVYQGGSELEELAEKLGAEEPAAFKTVGASFEHRPVTHKYSWSAGFHYITSSSEDFEVESFVFEGNVYWSPLRMRFFSFEVFAGANLSGSFRIKAKGNSEEEGGLYGTQFGIQSRIAPYQKWGATVGLAYRILKVTGLEAIDVSTTEKFELSTLAGVHLYAGLNYKF